MVISYRRNRKLIRHVILSGNWENFFRRAQLWSFLQVLALELVSVFFCLQSNVTYCLRALHSDCFIFLSQFCALTGLSWLVPLPSGLVVSQGFSVRGQLGLESSRGSTGVLGYPIPFLHLSVVYRPLFSTWSLHSWLFRARWSRISTGEGAEA